MGSCKKLAKRVNWSDIGSRDTKIVRVKQPGKGESGRCLYNSIDYVKANPTARLVCGYLITPGEGALYEWAENCVFKHVWVRHNREYIETTDVVPKGREYEKLCYVVDKQADPATWLLEDTLLYYSEGELHAPPSTYDEDLKQRKRLVELRQGAKSSITGVNT